MDDPRPPTDDKPRKPFSFPLTPMELHLISARIAEALPDATEQRFLDGIKDSASSAKFALDDLRLDDDDARRVRTHLYDIIDAVEQRSRGQL